MRKGVRFEEKHPNLSLAGCLYFDGIFTSGTSDYFAQTSGAGIPQRGFRSNRLFGDGIVGIANNSLFKDQVFYESLPNGNPLQYPP